MMFSDALSLVFLAAGAVSAAWDGSRFAWYTSDSANDIHNALPIGNGRLGAVVFGGAVEKLVLNENSVWSGPWQNRVNTKSQSAVGDIWKMLVSGSITAAGQSAMSNMAANPTSPRAYNPLVNVGMDFGHGSGMTNYTRWLDTYEGTSGVSYTYNGVTYTREYLASYPHGVLAFRLSSSDTGKLNVKLSLSRAQWVLSQEASINQSNSTGHSFSLSANSGQNTDAITFWSEARAINSGGTVTSDGKTVSITGANTVDVFFNAETSYRYSNAAAGRTELKRKLDAAVAAGYPAVRSAAVADFTNLSRRVNLNIGSSGDAGTLATPTRMSNFKKSPKADPEMITLMFNYGRHLLISSSRDTGPLSLPANLQGIWNQDYSPAWQSKYTININLEMNYWPALVTNLAETQKPVFDLLNVALPRGQAVAKTMYGCDGFVLHHNTDLWGDAAPVDKGTPYTIWPMGAAWLAFETMEHYRWTQNVTFLRETAWPILNQAATFLACRLTDWNGYSTLGPSLSPEHNFIVPSGKGLTQAGKAEGLDISIEMDNQLLRQLFTDVLTACSVLSLSNATQSTCSKAALHLPKIRPPGIASNGRIMEWRSDYSPQEPGHRHFSPLWGLYPGRDLTPSVSSTYSAAAKKLLDNRMSSGSGSTGWSRSWAINLYARLGEGDTAWGHVQALIQKFPSGNLWNSDSGPGSSFQIDGNFGVTAGIAECFLHSHDGVHLLPALPAAVAKGSVQGLVARGNFVVDMAWEGGKLVNSTVTARSGGSLALRVQNGVKFQVDDVPYAGPIQTKAGGVYRVSVV
ncbi:Six-hairpin glycosidase-like protein [Echria macrotheca]|uniref:Six-hairpin glycosidase-like protein n=1 Tax=Echria macrotheca TaxID=438768 RepID=A0AAJ0B8T7_9PEZI|nr:Six-hairpin glycosidase-like protein [Echria macrotheca]